MVIYSKAWADVLEGAVPPSGMFVDMRMTGVVPGRDLAVYVTSPFILGRKSVFA